MLRITTSNRDFWQILGGKMIFFYESQIFKFFQIFSKFSKSCEASPHKIWPVDWLNLGGMVMELYKGQKNKKC